MTHGPCPTSTFVGHATWYTSRATPGKHHYTHAMPRPAALDDSGTRDTVVSHIAEGGTQETAAQLLGVGRTTITRRMRLDPVFGERVRAASKRARTMGLERARSADGDTGPAAALAIERDGLDIGLPSAKWVVALLKKTAQNDDAKGQARAQLMLAELVVVPLVRARDSKLELDSDTDEPLRVVYIGPEPRQNVIDTTARETRNDS